MTKPRFRFTLRTLFFVLTTFATALGWVVYQLNWIRQRHAVAASRLATIDAREVEIKFHAQKFGLPIPTDQQIAPSEVVAPWSLRLFGEKGHEYIVIHCSQTDPEFERIKKLFPEARRINSSSKD